MHKNGECCKVRFNYQSAFIRYKFAGSSPVHNFVNPTFNSIILLTQREYFQVSIEWNERRYKVAGSSPVHNFVNTIFNSIILLTGREYFQV